MPVTDPAFSQAVNPQSFCTGVSLHHAALMQNTGPLIDVSDTRPGTNPVSRKSVKSAHSTRNRYSSRWTVTKCQASTPARTLASDWRTVGSQHGITVTESDSYSASLSQDTDKGRNSTVSTESASSTYEELARAYEHAKLEELLQFANAYVLIPFSVKNPQRCVQ
ncbi:cell adhesion molecule DSCAML1-like [Rhynochetos jubatus]